MKIVSITAKDVSPVRRFQVNELADVVVIAGPNGIGKTRLVNELLTFLQNLSQNGNITVAMQATCDEERADWGQDIVESSSADEARKIAGTLQKNRLRRNWRSSIVNFESDRTIQKIKPFNFSWDLPNPNEEEIGWTTTFSFMRDRFQDTLHAMFRMIEHQKRSIANRAIQLQREGRPAMQLNFSDPMESFKRVFHQLLAPKELVDPNPKDQALKYRIGDQEFGFGSLSSGEREVANIAFDFLLRNPSDCIIFFDEPELHLHPELSYRMIRALQTIGNNNQFIFCTHSPDIISSALEHSVVFLAPASDDEDGELVNQARVVREDDETNQALRLLGHSIGIISLGKRIVLIEGTQSSLDKQTYGSILQNRYPNLVLVPSEGKDFIKSFSVVTEKVLAKTLWGVEFFMLCDRDAMPHGVGADDHNSTAKLRTLSRYHLENYFLDEAVWEVVFSEMEHDESWLRSKEQIREKFKEIALTVVSYSAALQVAASVRQQVGNVSVMPRGCDKKTADELTTLMSQRIADEQNRVSNSLDVASVQQQIQEHFTTVETSIVNDTDEWKTVLPGRQILLHFLHIAKLDSPRAKRLYIRRASEVDPNPFAEIDEIFRSFSQFSQ